MPSNPLASAIAPGVKTRQALLTLAGPMLPDTEVASLLGMSPPDVERNRAAGRLLAVEVEGEWRFPAFQVHGPSLLPGMEELLVAVKGYDPWTVLDILLAPDSAFGGRSLLEILRAGDRDAFEHVLRQIGGDGYA